MKEDWTTVRRLAVGDAVSTGLPTTSGTSTDQVIDLKRAPCAVGGSSAPAPFSTWRCAARQNPYERDALLRLPRCSTGGQGRSVCNQACCMVTCGMQRGQDVAFMLPSGTLIGAASRAEVCCVGHSCRGLAQGRCDGRPAVHGQLR
jgi:hypothetical protein